MTLFVDASAMVALLLREPEREQLVENLQADADRIWSAIARWETVINVARVRKYGLADAQAEVDQLASLLDIRLVPLSELESSIAVEAFDAFGKNRHPAGLNMGDCFAYACAKAHQARLLYKGNDFAQTDLA